jgi:heptosyltransferase-1
LPWGDAQEQERAERIKSSVTDAVVLPKLKLRELAGVIAQATAVIGVDTGLVHLAAALGRPTVAIYIDSFPHLTGLLPTDPRHAVSLGGKGAMPPVAEVTQALAWLGIC